MVNQNERRKPQFIYRRGTEIPTTSLRWGEIPIVRKLAGKLTPSKRTIEAIAAREMNDTGRPVYPEDMRESLGHLKAAENISWKTIRRGPAKGRLAIHVTPQGRRELLKAAQMFEIALHAYEGGK